MLKRALIAALAVALFSGCASTRMSDRVIDEMFRSGRYEEASARLQKGLAEQGEDGRDRLLYLLDLGLTLHSQGKFEESNKVLLEADKIAEIKDYTSLAAESATLLTSDNIKDYKGEDFEKVLINTYLSMNYALMGDFENALVEARRVNRKLYLMVSEGERKYKQNAFARYLSAVIYEADGQYNDAYVDYKQARELMPEFTGLGRDLWRVARLLGMRDETERWEKEFELSKEDRRLAMDAGPRSGKAEIIVLYENGISPVKGPHPAFSSLPKFYPRFNPVSYANVEAVQVGDAGAVVGAVASGARFEGVTAVLHNVETTAIENLDEKYAGLIARKVAGVVAKEIVGDQVARATKNEGLGLLVKLFFYVSDQADTRSWNLLPRDLQISRLVVPPGTYEVRALPVGGTALPGKTVQVGAGKKVFVGFRYIP